MTMGPEPMTRIFRIEVSLGMVVRMVGKVRSPAITPGRLNFEVCGRDHPACKGWDARKMEVCKNAPADNPDPATFSAEKRFGLNISRTPRTPQIVASPPPG